MKNWFFGLAMVAVSATAVQAATVTATSNYSFIGSFTASYTDTNGNSLWDLSETTAFSGFSYDSRFWDSIIQLAAVAGISASSTANSTETYVRMATSFSPGSYLNAPAVAWSFSVVPDLPAVPLPAGMPLLLAGVGALAVLRRRRARG